MAYQKEILRDKNILSGNICYYLVSTSELSTLPNEINAIPPLNAVQNAYYFPYLSSSLNDYGTGGESCFAFETCEALKTETGITIEWFTGTSNPEACQYRQPRRIIKNLPSSQTDRVLNSPIMAYTTKPDTVGGNWNYRNESKLQQYPYRYLELNDGLMNPIILEPQKLGSKSLNEIRVKQYLNPSGAYQIYIPNYSGDETGLIHSWHVDGLDVPVANNHYLNYLNENKLQRSFFYMGQLTNALNPVNIKTSGGMNVIDSLSNTVSQIVKEEDMKQIPNQLTLGGNYQQGLQTFDFLYEFVYECQECEMERMGLFFHQYGYAQNKLMTPNTKSRKYFNYLEGDILIQSNQIPKEHLEKLTSIFQNGTTIWHMDTPNNFIGNYIPDNVEV